MAAQYIRFDRLDAPGRDRVMRALAQPPIHTEPATGAPIAWAALALAGAITLLLFWLLDAGIWLAAIGIALVVRSALGIWRGVRRSRLPWRAARFLYPFGFVDARTARLRILPITDFSGFAVESDGQPIGLITIIVNFGEYASEKFPIFGSANNIPTAKLDALTNAPHPTLADLPLVA